MLYFWLPIVAALIDWAALAKGWDRLQPLTKPAVMAALLAWILLVPGEIGAPRLLFSMGVLFGLAGDIFLLPALDRFLPALGLFLAGHVAYIAGLNTTLPPINLSTFMFALVVALPAWQVYRRVLHGMAAGGAPGLRFPALVYAFTLSLMLFSGLATLAREAWLPSAALLTATGAVLFAASDILLVWNRFVQPISNARLKTRIPYHVGQILLTAGVLLNLS